MRGCVGGRRGLFDREGPGGVSRTEALGAVGECLNDLAGRRSPQSLGEDKAKGEGEGVKPANGRWR